MHLLFHEIFGKLVELPDREDKINWLRKHGTQEVKDFILGMFSDDIRFDVELPETYKTSIYPEGLNYELLQNEMQRAYLFVEGHPKRPVGLTKQRQTAICRDILENVHVKEAELFHQWLQKKVRIPTFSKELASEAFPDLGIKRGCLIA